MKIQLNHVGWVTNNKERFEDFWCKGLGFEKIWEFPIDPVKVKALFGLDEGATAIRYQKDNMIIEVHVFPTPLPEHDQTFKRFGINHICLLVENREEFITELSEKIQFLKVHRFLDLRGWYNLFIRDGDGNWIELRENFK